MGHTGKIEVVEALISWARKLKKEGVTNVEIDRMMGFPTKWGGRIAWGLVSRPRQEWEAPGTAPEPKPSRRQLAQEREMFGFRTASGPTPSGRFCSACGSPLAGPFCGVCGTRAAFEAPAFVPAAAAPAQPVMVASTSAPRARAKGPIARRRTK